MTVLYLYLICHDNPDIKTHTYVGCTENFLKRLNQHNCLESGGPRITRRAAGSWNPVLILQYDKEFHTTSSKNIKSEWKQSSRGLTSRIKRGFEMAKKYKLPIIMPKNQIAETPLLRFLSDKWVDEKLALTDADWDYILTSAF
jgi:predicted GIY-YIG superfamily endonuclease